MSWEDAWTGWYDGAWATLAPLEGWGCVLVPLCPANHRDTWAACPKPGKVPARLATDSATIHQRGWAEAAAAGGQLDLAEFRRVQEARRRAGRRTSGWRRACRWRTGGCWWAWTSTGRPGWRRSGASWAPTASQH